MNHAATPNQQLSQQAERSRIYHVHLADLDAAIRELEANPARYTLAEFDDLLRGLLAERARRVAEWERSKIT